MIPENLRYHKEHEWVRVEGKQAVLGISDHAQEALGDIVFFQLPRVGATVSAGQEKGYFQFGGSTVILVLEPGRVLVDDDLVANTRRGLETFVRMGEGLGRSV